MRPIVDVPQKDRATDIGNMHKNLDMVKIARVVPEISWRTDRHTYRYTETDRPTHRQTYLSQYFKHKQVVKVMAASPLHTDGSVVFAKWRQCAPHK